MRETLGAVRHHLSQPITAAFGTVQIIRENLRRGELVTNEDLEIIERNLTRASDLLHKLGKIKKFETEPYVRDQRILKISQEQEPGS